MRKKKIQVNPKSELGLKKTLRICYNCLFRHKDTGFCPMLEEYFDYNHPCSAKNGKLFRYRLEYNIENTIY